MTGCDCPGCRSPAMYEVVARNAGDATGKTFSACERHTDAADFRRPVGVSE